MQCGAERRAREKRCEAGVHKMQDEPEPTEI